MGILPTFLDLTNPGGQRRPWRAFDPGATTGVLSLEIFVADSRTRMTIRPDLTANLGALTKLLNDFGMDHPACSTRVGAPHQDCRRVSLEMPLAHSTGAKAFQAILQEGRILSPAELMSRGTTSPTAGRERVEMLLGTWEDVFTYAAPFRYPETSCGFLFKKDIEEPRRSTAVATPFDSGGTIHHLRPSDSLEDQIAFVRRHELPVPAYRALFELFLGVVFETPWHYVDGVGPDHPGPFLVEGGDCRRWTFEVRFAREMEITGSLLAVFMPAAVASTEWALDQIPRWKRQGVDLVYYRSPKGNLWSDLSRLCIDYVERHLERNNA